MTDQEQPRATQLGDSSKFSIQAINTSKNLYQINARNTHVAEDLQFIMQSTLPGVLTGENCFCVGTIFKA